MDEATRFETKSVTSIRGGEARAIAKAQSEGWEFVSQAEKPLLRTELTFRRPVPKQPKWMWPAVAAVGVTLAAVIAFNALADRQSEPTATAAASSTPTEEAAAPTTAASAAPEEEDPAPEAPAAPTALTVENNADFAALLSGSDSDWDGFEAFAAEYGGRTLEFDAWIGAMNNHAGYETRYDILIVAGNEGDTSGPSFQFRDVNMTDLNLVGDDIPDAMGPGDNLHVVAELDEFNEQQSLMLLSPVSTEFR